MPESFHARFPVSAISLYSDLRLFFAPSTLVASVYRPRIIPSAVDRFARDQKPLVHRAIAIEVGRFKVAGRAVLKTARRNS